MANIFIDSVDTTGAGTLFKRGLKAVMFGLNMRAGVAIMRAILGRIAQFDALAPFENSQDHRSNGQNTQPNKNPIHCIDLRMIGSIFKPGDTPC